MIAAILTMVVVWCLFYGKIPVAVLAVFCVGFGLAFGIISKHKSSRLMVIDVLAQVSCLKKVNPLLKFWVVITLMVLCVSATNPVVGIYLAITVLVLVVYIGGLKFYDYIHILALPVSFLMMSGLVQLFEVTTQPIGVFGFRLFGFWFCVSAVAQDNTVLVMARALGAVSCLYLLSLTTPMAELIGVLRRLRCPNVLIELMYLIYRYIFILFSMYQTMGDAAKSRLGYRDYPTSLRTTGSLYSNLLSRSYRMANKNFDAMESRCYDTEIRFLENRERVTGVQTVVSIGIIISTLSLSLLLH